MLPSIYSIPQELIPDANTILQVTAVITIFSLIMFPVCVLIASFFVYRAVMWRTNKEKWNGNMSDVDPTQIEMYEKGYEWHKSNIQYSTQLHIKNDGLNLFGEYYDFGSDKCVIILSGRSESMHYSYYFAIPYSRMGMNVLVIDSRAHGKSDGVFNTAGFEESKDDLAWAAYIHEIYGIKSIIFHGICIGAAGGMYAVTSANCPEYIKGIVVEGMFANFGESMKNHLIERKKNIIFINPMLNFWMKHYTGHTMNYGPIDVIDKMDKPLLMIHSREDIYSTPEYAQKLYDRCPGASKELVWFDHGKHSMLRKTDEEKYDFAIQNFVVKNF